MSNGWTLAIPMIFKLTATERGNGLILPLPKIILDVVFLSNNILWYIIHITVHWSILLFLNRSPLDRTSDMSPTKHVTFVTLLPNTG